MTENRYHLVTFGCQMNKYDSEKIEGILASSGMASVDDPAKAGVVVINTCSIREKAESKVFSFVGRVAAHKRNNPGLLIALGGCMATFNKKDIFAKAPSLDIVFGPDTMDRIPELISMRRVTGEKQADVGFSESSSWDAPETFVRKSSVTAWVGIMKGCDNRCTYCVVPDARGPEVSRPAEAIVREIESLAQNGYREVTLIGQNVNSYGVGLGGGAGFTELLGMVEGVDGIDRIRFMTSHPKDLTDELVEAMGRSSKICPSLHLPLQSGSDRVLEMMKRGYTKGGYLEKVRKVRDAVKGITLSTDLMFGFPGETEEDFMDTYRVMEDVRYDSAFLFNYSRRRGTPAADYDGQVSRMMSQERFERAFALHRKIVGEKNAAMVGREVEVLCEEQYNVSGENKNGADAGAVVVFGRTPGNHLVSFHGEGNFAGKMATVTVSGVKGYDLTAELVRLEEQG